ncbi:MAG TPA: glucose-6-phosphate dehydrogenase assembly protein OpcA [Pyrinomonadaceae bacterium]
METQRHESAVALPTAKGIDVVRLERELTAMWSKATAGEEGKEGPGVMRACVLNLIVYEPLHQEREAIDALLDEVFESNPCRALIIFADANSTEERLDARVSTRCSQSSKGARQICGEQVTIEASGAAVARAGSAVAALLVPDVPVFLWWKDIPHYEDKLFERLVGVADRVVIDSAAFDHPREDLLRLAEVVRANPEYMAASDLCWGRLTPWRSMLASFWDVKDYAPHLRALDRIEITFDSAAAAAGPKISAPALLCAGWLCSRLGWKVVRCVASGEDAPAEVELSAADGRGMRLVFKHAGRGTVETSGLRSLALKSEETGAEFWVELKMGEAKLETATRLGASGRVVGRLTDFPVRSEGEWLSGELALLTRDKVYEQAVAACAEVLKSLNR